MSTNLIVLIIPYQESKSKMVFCRICTAVYPLRAGPGFVLIIPSTVSGAYSMYATVQPGVTRDLHNLLVTTCCDEGYVVILSDASSNKEVGRFRGHGAEILCGDLSMDNSLLVTGDDDGRLLLWDVLTMSDDALCLQQETPATHVCFPHHRKDCLVSLGLDDELCHILYIWDLEARRERCTSSLHTYDDERHLSVTNDDANVVTVGWKEINVYSLTTGESIATYYVNDWFCTALCTSPVENNIIAVGGATGEIFLWDLVTGPDTKAAVVVNADRTTCLCYSNDGSVLYCCSMDGTIKSFDVVSQQATLIARTGPFVNSMALSPDETRVAVWLDSGIRIYRVASGDLISAQPYPCISVLCYSKSASVILM
jgi:WD40 repeat protein